MAYDTYNRRQYRISAVNMAATPKVVQVHGPRGKSGRLIDYGFENFTVAAAGATTQPTVTVGSPTVADAYGKAFSSGILPIGESRTVLSSAIDIPTLLTFMPANAEIPPSGVVTITANPATGAGAAGTADIVVLIEWAT